MAQPPISYIASSKLEAPTLTPWHVRREQLLERAAQAPVPRVLLVCAPAGFGKTTLLAQLAQQARAGGDAVAWLTLDGADNDAARFVACLAAATGALMAAAETLDGANHPANRQADHPADEAALALLAALAACTEPFMLFLDEFEHVTDPAVLGLTRALIARLPPDAQIVIGARSLPDLGLGGLRARGRALEFDADALRFSLDESSAFLARRTSLPVQDVQALHRTAEGWAAALWLAAAALERHPHSHAFVDGFSGSQAALASYLADDVLARQDAPIRQFLLRTSILRTLSAPLCDAVLGRADSAALLQAIANANLFLGMRRDAAGEYRYHGLFAGFLRSRLAAQAPHDLPVLHAAASRWYEAQGRAVPAIDHAIEAGDVQRSVAMLTQHAGGLIAEGRGGLLGRWRRPW